MRRLLALAVATVLLTACEAPPVYGPSPTPAVTPFFANEEEALEAVDAFMGEYVAALTLLAKSRGADDAAMVRLVGPDQLADEREFAASLVERGLTFEGKYSYFRLEIQQFHQDSASEAFLQAYVCIDYRDTHFIDTAGAVLTGEVQWAPFEAIMMADRSDRIRLDELRGWTGRNFCELSA